MAGPTAATLTSQRIALNRWHWGDADRPLLVLVHGGRDHARSWDDVAAAFADDWHVVAPDLRGHGLSGWSDGGAYGIEHFVVDLDRLMAALGVTPERPVTIVAHSLGGNIALRWTALNTARVRRIVAIEGLGPGPIEAPAPIAERLARWIDAVARRDDRSLPVYPDLAAATARMRAAHPGFSADLAARLTAHGVRDVPGGVSFAHDPLLLAWNPVDITPAEKAELWAAIDCPVMLAWGRDSWATDPQADGRIAWFRDARRVAFDGAGHWLHHDARDAFVEAVRRFIA